MWIEMSIWYRYRDDGWPLTDASSLAGNCTDSVGGPRAQLRKKGTWSVPFFAIVGSANNDNDIC